MKMSCEYYGDNPILANNLAEKGYGDEELDQTKLPGLLKLKFHATSNAAALFGDVALIRDAFIGFQKHFYQEVNT